MSNIIKIVITTSIFLLISYLISPLLLSISNYLLSFTNTWFDGIFIFLHEISLRLMRVEFLKEFLFLVLCYFLIDRFVNK